VREGLKHQAEFTADQSSPMKGQSRSTHIPSARKMEKKNGQMNLYGSFNALIVKCNV
jgi:hypothetical protein